MISTTTLTIDVTNKVGRLTDTTDYASLGISVASFVAKGLGSIYFQGNLIESGTTVGDPLIDLEVGDTFFEFPLELDLNGNVANGIYAVDYSLRIDTSAFNLGVEGITLPSTLEINGGSSGWLADFLEAGDQITLYNPVPSLTQQVVTVATVNLVDPGLPTAMVVITTNEVITTDTWPFWSVSITNPQSSTTYTYAGCTQTTADVNFVYDCEVGDNGSWSVSNATSLATNEVIDSLNCTINYPSWTTLSPTFPGNVVLTSLPYPSAPGTETPLATGTYTVSLSQQIQQLQTDGLIIVYLTTVVKEFAVSCAGSLCGLTPCIENLRVAHANELQRNRISKYQVFVDNVLLYYAEAQNYKSCGDTANYRATIDLIRANLDSSGCECACCDDNTYYWVSNNSSVSVIESLIESFQFRLFNLTPPGPGSPLISDDVAKGVQVGACWQNVNTQIIYICTNNDPGNAQWELYYDPNEAPPGYDATDITYAGAALFPGPTNVATALDDTSTILTSQALSISNLFTALGVTNAAVAGKLTANAPIVGAQRTKITYDTNGLVVAGTTLSASDIPSGVLATKIGTGIVDNTEFGYLNGVTSNIQTQLNSKLPSNLTADTILDYNNFNFRLNNGTNQTDIVKSQSPTSSAAALTVQARNASAGVGFGSSIQLSANVTGNSTQIPLATISGSWVDAGNGDSKLSLTTTKGETESVKMEISEAGQVKLNEYDSTLFVDASPSYLLGVDAAGNVVQTTPTSSGPLVYAGLITGNAGTVALTEYENTTGATITIVNTTTGQYYIQASPSVFVNAVIFLTPVVPCFLSAVINPDNIFIKNHNTSGVYADQISNTKIKIEIYP